MKVSHIVAVGALMSLLGIPLATLGESTRYLCCAASSVLRGFFKAEDANNVDAALMCWADDGMFVNSRGQKRVGREQLRPRGRERRAGPHLCELADHFWLDRLDRGNHGANIGLGSKGFQAPAG